MAISVSQRGFLRVRGRGLRAYCRVQLGGSRYFSCYLSRLSCFFVAVSAPSSWLSSSPHTEFGSHSGYQKHSKTAPAGLDAEAWRLRQGFAAASADWLRPPLFLRGQGCVEFAWHSRDGSLGEHIKAALGSHDVELVSIAATSVVSHNGCNSTALPGGNVQVVLEMAYMERNRGHRS